MRAAYSVRSPPPLAGEGADRASCSIHRQTDGFDRRCVLRDLAQDKFLQIGRRAALGRDGNGADLLELLCTEGVSIAVTVASWSFWMTGSGVPFGKKKPNHVLASKSSPCSRALASSGSMVERSRERIAMALISLPSICGFAVALSVQK